MQSRIEEIKKLLASPKYSVIEQVNQLESHASWLLSQLDADREVFKTIIDMGFDFKSAASDLDKAQEIAKQRLSEINK